MVHFLARIFVFTYECNEDAAVDLRYEHHLVFIKLRLLLNPDDVLVDWSLVSVVRYPRVYPLDLMLLPLAHQRILLRFLLNLLQPRVRLQRITALHHQSCKQTSSPGHEFGCRLACVREVNQYERNLAVVKFFSPARS